MKILMTHPTGNNNVRAVMESLTRANMLAEFNTTISVNAQARWLNYLGTNLRNQLLRRNFRLPEEMLKSHPMRELVRIILPKVGIHHLSQKENSWASIDSVYRKLDASVANKIEATKKSKQITAVYGYEDGAFETFKKAKSLGLTCIYDLPIAYWETSRKLIQEEALRLPEWAETLGGGISDSDEKLQRKSLEMEMADVVVAPGKFVVDSIPEWARNKHQIVSPFGSPDFVTAENFPRHFQQREKKLRVLFVGSMTQRKGLGDLFNAVKLLNSSHIELVVLGTPMVPLAFYEKQLPSFTFLPTRAHDQVLKVMRSCDVFCLPSIVEGRALVMQEAMSQGMPLIITANTGGSDLIKEGQTGFLVPIRSAETIADKLQWFLENKIRINEMGKLAQAHAAEYTWDAYGAKIVTELRKHSS